MGHADGNAGQLAQTCCLPLVCVCFGGQCLPSPFPPPLMGSVMDLPPSIRNPSSLFYQKDAVRRSIIKSYWVVIVLALPLWWYTTSIERLALPTGRIDKFVDKHLELPVTICAPSTRVSDLHREIVARRALDQKRWAGLAVEVVESEKCSV